MGDRRRIRGPKAMAAALALAGGLAASMAWSSTTAPAAGAASGGAPACIYTPTDFANAFLAALGDPQSQQNLTFLLAWEKKEGGNWDNTATFNPLNTERPFDGSVSFQWYYHYYVLGQADGGGYAKYASGIVQAYQKWSDGLQSTVSTITNGYYGPILTALANGTSVTNDVNALAGSPWGTGNVSGEIGANGFVDYSPTAPSWEGPCAASTVSTSGWSWIPTGTPGGAEFCRPVGAGPDWAYSFVSCDSFTGSAFGTDVTSPVVDWGYSGSRAWVTVSAGPAKATDYCRAAGPGPDNVGSNVSCTTFNGAQPGVTVASPILDWGYLSSAQWVSLPNGTVDYCRRAGVHNNVGSYVLCTSFNGTAFGPTVASPILDWGYDAGAQWVPLPNGTVDYCRRAGVHNNVGSYVLCTSFNGTAFGPTVASPILDWGYDAGAQWVPLPNGTVDYCRRAGVDNNVGSYVLCTSFNGTAFGPTVASPILDWGYDAGAQWVPFPNGILDYCRRAGAGNDSYLVCTSFNGTAFGGTGASAVLNWGYDAGAQWVALPNGTAAYCAWATASALSCTAFNGLSFGSQVTSPPGDVTWGFDT